MTEPSSAGDLLGGDLGRLMLVICALAAALVLVPFALASIGFSAMAGAASGVHASTAVRATTEPAAARPAATAPSPLLAPTPLDAQLTSASQLIAVARSWLGTRYVFGGCSPSGIDCSCFVQTVFRSVGIELPRTSQQQFNATVGRGFDGDRPQPGDLVFFFRTYFDPTQDWTHVGVVSRIDSNGVVWMIDAPGARAATDPPDAPFGRVREEPVARNWLQHRPTYGRIHGR